MIIEESDFRLIPDGEALSRFNLELLATVNKGKSNERKEFKLAGYGYTLENAIRNIISYRINNKYESGTIDMKTYLQEYREQVNKLSEICKV